jgi:hypothetical protein
MLSASLAARSLDGRLSYANKAISRATPSHSARATGAVQLGNGSRWG